MKKLEKNNFYKIKNFLNEKNNHYPMMKSVISGIKPGTVYTNFSENAFFIINNDGWSYFLGDLNDNDFNNDIEKIILKEAGNKAINFLWFDMPEIFREYLKKYTFIKIYDFPRYRFTYSGKKEITEKEYENYTLYEIDEKNIEKYKEVYDEIKPFWNEKENFFQKGFGYILQHGEKLAGYVFLASNEDNEGEIDIIVSEDYRNKGISKYLSSKIIKKCISYNIKPKWDCDVSTAASVKTAQYLGFEIKEKYNCSYITEINKAQ